MPFSKSSSRAAAARRAVAAEIERIAADLRAGPVEDALAALLGGEILPPQVLREALFTDGVPHVRPVLVHLAAQAAAPRTAEFAAAGDVALVAELLHTAIVLHDATLGRQDGRRRRAARRVLRGATAFLGGSHLTLRVMEIARRAPAPEILGDALDALREVAEGQALRASFEHREPSAAEALSHHESRHGAVFAFSCKAGGRLAGASRPVVTRLGRYGRHTGVAWQLAEDLAAFEPQDDWRALTRRAEGGRPLYPLAWAGGVDPQLPALWRRLGERADPALAADLATRVRDAGGLSAGREALVGQTWAARLALTTVPESSARDALDRIVASLSQIAA
jgi:geranylgeranyl pyrophosphate synthase